MDDLREALTTARRLHAFLTLAAGAVLVAVAPVGTEHEQALDEIRVIRELTHGPGWVQHCEQVEEAWFDRYWAPVKEELGLDRTILSWQSYYPRLAASATVSEHLEFLVERWQPMQVTVFDKDSVAEFVRRHREAGTLQHLSSEWTGASADIEEDNVFDHPFMNTTGAVSWASDSVSVLLGFETSGGEFSQFRDSVPGWIRIIPLGQSPLLWLQSTRPDDFEVLERHPGGAPFPGLASFSDEVYAMTLDGASQYLRARGAERGGNVEVFGLKANTEVVAWAGPTLLVFLLVHLLLHLWHAERIAGAEVETFRRFSWIGLFTDGSSRATSLITLWVLPVVAGALVTWRVASAGILVSGFTAGATILTATLGFRVVKTLDRIRALVHSSSPTGE